VVTILQKQAQSREDPRFGGIAGAAENQAVSAASILEHRSFSSRPSRCRKVFCHPKSEQFSASSAKSNPKGVQDELFRHIKEDSQMSSFDFGVQFLDAGRMSYWGSIRDPDFWIENASVEWSEADAPFYRVGRLTLLRNSQLPAEASEAVYFDVTNNSMPDSKPVGSINRARCPAEPPAGRREGADGGLPSGVAARGSKFLLS